MVEYTYEALPDAFTLGDIVLVPDTYQFVVGSMELATSIGRPLMVESTASAGGYYGGWQAGGEVGPTWAPSPHVSFGVRYGYHHVSALDETFDAHVARVRLGGALNRQLSGSAYVQFNSNDELVTTNIRIRYNPAEGNDLYIVYNEGLNTRYDPLDPLGPRRPRLNTRTLLIKYTYTFAL
jgi:hypothetical protein